MPDVRESIVDDPEEPLRAAFDGLKNGIWTAMPAIVSKDSDGKVVSVKMVIKGQTSDEKGEKKTVDYPVLADVPVHFVGGGGEDKDSVVFTHPIKEKDEGVVIFMSRPMDNWFEKGGVQKGSDLRTHSLSDAMYIPGFRSKPRELKNVSTKTAQMRSVDGKAFVVDYDSKGKITTSVDEGKHTVTIDKEAGITHKSTMKVHIEAPKMTSKGTWNHDGGMRTTGVLQSDVGLKSPVIASAPGDVTDVPTS